MSEATRPSPDEMAEANEIIRQEDGTWVLEFRRQRRRVIIRPDGSREEVRY